MKVHAIPYFLVGIFCGPIWGSFADPYRTMKYQCKQEMVTYVAKGRQPFLFSEVVQRYSGDEKVIC